jgi:hypothetical protein
MSQDGRAAFATAEVGDVPKSIEPDKSGNSTLTASVGVSTVHVLALTAARLSPMTNARVNTMVLITLYFINSTSVC